MTQFDRLESVPLYGGCVEQFVLRRDHCREWPFFAAFDRFMEEFLSSADNGIDGLSYAIWGGVASEVLLGLLGLCSEHFSLHDIEFFFVRNQQIVLDDEKTKALNEVVSTDSRFLLELGGVPIVTRIGEISVLEFQRQRTLRNDGDLCLNGLVLLVDRVLGTVTVSGPVGTIGSLENSGAALRVKDSSGIDSLERASRRIFRNVAKAIRFERVAGLSAGLALEVSTTRLVHFTCEKWDDNSGSAAALSQAALSSANGTRDAIRNAQDRMTWLWATTLCETTKRLAGLSGCSSLDKSAFDVFYWECVGGLLKHPLMLAIANALASNGWNRVEIGAGTVARCFADFRIYQKPSAELLHAKYSLRP